MDLVSIICLCHNQAKYVEEALQSVLDQTHGNIELIIVDDGSTDGSKAVVQSFLEKHNHKFPFIDIPTAVGNCAAINKGWKVAKGDYFIDLAADDILLPNRVEVGLKSLANSEAAVHFSDAFMISESGKILKKHNDRFSFDIPQGDIYAALLSRYVICPPTMMFKRTVLEKLDGYDENLSFEDFDFWVRSSRYFKYAFTNEPLVKKRLVKHSHSEGQNKMFNKHQKSTLKVCQKALKLNKTPQDFDALIKRCWLEIRQCIKKGNLGLIPSYLSLIAKCQV